MFVLTEQSSIANHFIAELRDVRIQKDPLRFRRNLERLGEILAYEISKTLTYTKTEVETPLGTSKTFLMAQQPVLAAVLRASLPFHQGFLNAFDGAQNAFIGAYRGLHAEGEEFTVELEYISCPDLTGKTLIIVDPMLATGKSLEISYRSLLRYGIPARTHIAAAIAAPEGIKYLQERMPECRLWVGDIDERLNHNYYIIPGLGDAGDLAFGEKL
ncbi:uracil phosphoribosyltransferase [Siphonobacter sp. BAB-5385]|uniref:uracil phosphoribosyltransferase n=1 Tax=unclassified Siphonobacter TaxID=2635712 RepID=UPI000B9E991C|nr:MULTISPECIES: uracil phosphoribosyltransferase [unclassified Siphonobacter]OZI07695.1 uracil phosphoribosyltransferase [Siphonobacter sp. BAB-5385]PMD96171.1 uracil phosphoribosyltransferase [Siphonobacter sp. BAB-5405]